VVIVEKAIIHKVLEFYHCLLVLAGCSL